jgi:hypothetical protein
MSDPVTDRPGSLRAADTRDEGDAPAFRVIDRRRFAPDGSERSDDEPQPEAPASEAPRSGSAPASQAAPQAEPEPELATPKGAPYEGEAGAPAEPTFGTLLISLSTQALMYLGEMEIPGLEGGGAHKDLPAARNIIDLLAVLESKTTGNLDPDEAALLEQILYDLRMRFVAISRG